MPVILKKTGDFSIDGAGGHPAWHAAQWYTLSRVGGKKNYETRFRALYSDSGLYFLFECEDKKLTCTMEQDFDDLYNEDVLELFLQPDESLPLYLEYELSPLNRELVLLVSNRRGEYFGWLPFHYEKERRTRHKTRIQSGKALPMADCRGWSAEVFLPFALFEGVLTRPLAPGTVWRGNCFRIDYDDNEASRYAYSSACGVEFHDYTKYDAFIFE